MRYVQLSAYGNGWAESIIFKKHRELIANGDESWVFWARANHEQDDHMVKIASYFEVCADVFLTRIDGRAGFHSRRITRRVLRRLDEINPDVVHLHVLCGYWINIEMLFEWLSCHRCRVIWTLHDCWAFTGHCIHFTHVECMQWRTQCAACISCPQRHEYPETYFGGDESVRWCHEKKKHLFTMLPSDRMSLVVPSQWLANLVAQSFLNKYEIKVVRNVANTDIFKPTPSDFRNRYDIGDRFMVLGVAGKWSERKGLRDFICLADELDSSRFAIVVIGLTKGQIRQMSGRLIALPRMGSAEELAAAYTSADVFFNPTLEDNFPTVNLEAESCGTPVITYDTGGCSETISLDASRVVSDLEEAKRAILQNAENVDYCLSFLEKSGDE